MATDTRQQARPATWRVAQAIRELRHAGEVLRVDQPQLALHLGLARPTITTYITEARMCGWVLPRDKYGYFLTKADEAALDAGPGR